MKFTVDTLGECTVDSPIKISNVYGDKIVNYVDDKDAILYDIDVKASMEEMLESRIIQAGPREKIYFEAKDVKAAIVTCGGLCPGLNNVIRSVVRCLWYSYGVRDIIGIKNGYAGFLPEFDYDPIVLDPDYVDDAHAKGGTIIGTSRGNGYRTGEIVDSLQEMGVNMFFCIGGDGTLKGAQKVAVEAKKRGLDMAVIGIPKTIDNDISLLQRSFGFETSVSKASESVQSAHTEAKSAHNGVGLVKLMGRESGFIASHAAIAATEANFVLIPEIEFELEGPNGFFEALRKRLENRKHAVIIVAEGAGQELMEATDETDLSGNKKLNDIGIFLRDKITEYFKKIDMEMTLKYIDPSYIVRSAPADANDSFYCARLGAHAVHAAMAGKTNALVSLVNDRYVYVPIGEAVSEKNCVDPEGYLWRDVLEATLQPICLRNIDE